MHDEEGDKQVRANEINRARRLPSAEQRQNPGKGRIHLRATLPARSKLQRQQNEDHGEIGELLDDVVALGFVALRKCSVRCSRTEAQKPLI